MPRIVVGAAVVRDGLLLGQCRAAPPELAGRWELPGGQVEPGESEPDALRRECREELGADITVRARIGGDLALSARFTLRVYAAVLAPGSPEPAALEHTALAWLAADELADVDWLDADRLLLPELAVLLGPPASAAPRTDRLHTETRPS